jgi:hypothetical protein
VTIGKRLEHRAADNAAKAFNTSPRATVLMPTQIFIGELMDGKRAAGELAIGTRGWLKGKRAGTGKGRGKAKANVSGAVFETAPEMKSLSDLGIDTNLAKAARKAASTPLDRYVKRRGISTVATRVFRSKYFSDPADYAAS